MRRLILGSVLGSAWALSLAFSPSATLSVLAHAGHGDEFQAEGGVNRVEVNPQTDPILGIQVDSIESAADGGAVTVPVSALVEDNGRQLVFVQHENFYEPVPVTTGETEGEMIEVLEGLSVGEQLVTQGSLSLYAESRKTQTADAVSDTASDADSESGAVAIAEDAAPTETAASPTESSEDLQTATAVAEPSSGFPVGLVAAVGAGAAVVIGGAAFALSGKRKEDANAAPNLNE